MDEDEVWAREREAKVGATFQEFRDIVENRPGVEETGRLGSHQSRLGALHVDGPSSTGDHPTGTPEDINVFRREKMPRAVGISVKK